MLAAIPIRALVSAGGRNQSPVRIRRARVAGERPEVHHLDNRFRIALDDQTGRIEKRRYLLAEELDRDVSGSPGHVRFDQRRYDRAIVVLLLAAALVGAWNAL